MSRDFDAEMASIRADINAARPLAAKASAEFYRLAGEVATGVIPDLMRREVASQPNVAQQGLRPDLSALKREANDLDRAMADQVRGGLDRLTGWIERPDEPSEQALAVAEGWVDWRRSHGPGLPNDIESAVQSAVRRGAELARLYGYAGTTSSWGSRSESDPPLWAVATGAGSGLGNAFADYIIQLRLLVKGYRDLAALDDARRRAAAADAWDKA